MQSNGARARFGWGVLADYHFNETTALSFGVNMDFQGGSLKFKENSDSIIKQKIRLRLNCNTKEVV